MSQEYTHVKSTNIEKEQLLVCAKINSNVAKDSTAKRRKNGNRRGVGSSNFLINAPLFHVENDTENFIRAGEAFQLYAKWIDAADSYAKAAWMKGNASQSANEAAFLYAEAAFCMEKVATGYGEDHFSRIQQIIAENHEKKKNVESAITAFQHASKYYETHQMEDQSLNCLRQVAFFGGLVGRYSEASELYALIGYKQLTINMTKYNVCNSFFRSGLLLLSMGPSKIDTARQKLSDFIKASSHFEISREREFLHNTALMLERRAKDEFADHIYNYDNVCLLDSWCLKLLSRIRIFIESD